MINFILGLIIGGLIGIGIMCLLQINRDNKAQRRIIEAIDYIKHFRISYKASDETNINQFSAFAEPNDLIEILGGDVDDE